MGITAEELYTMCGDEMLQIEKGLKLVYNGLGNASLKAQQREGAHDGWLSAVLMTAAHVCFGDWEKAVEAIQLLGGFCAQSTAVFDDPEHAQSAQEALQAIQSTLGPENG